MKKKTGSPHILRCSFCGRGQDEVTKLISGPSVYICNECVDVCGNILDKELNPPDSGGTGKKGKTKSSHSKEDIPTPSELLAELAK